MIVDSGYQFRIMTDKSFFRRVALFLLVLPLALILSERTVAQDDVVDSKLWHAIKDGRHIAIMRHGLAPGIGDPENFSLDDCETQRNLSDVGREQVRQIGKQFRQHGIRMADVFSSQWCRCRETAELLDLGSVNDLPELNSFFRNMDQAAEQNEKLMAWLTTRQPEIPLVLVTHQVNIRALTGLGTVSGEVVVFQLNDTGGVTVLGQIAIPY